MGSVRNKLKRPEFHGNRVIFTFSIPMPVLKAIDSLLGKLYTSRSQAICQYIMQSLHKDLALANALDGNFEPVKERITEINGEEYFLDKHDKLWFIGQMKCNVGRPIKNV